MEQNHYPSLGQVSTYKLANCFFHSHLALQYSVRLYFTKQKANLVKVKFPCRFGLVDM